MSKTNGKESTTTNQKKARVKINFPVYLTARRMECAGRLRPGSAIMIAARKGKK